MYRMLMSLGLAGVLVIGSGLYIPASESSSTSENISYAEGSVQIQEPSAEEVQIGRASCRERV